MASNRGRRMAILSARIFGGMARKTAIRDYNVVHLFSHRPWQRDLPSWYPPLGMYTSLLIRLRSLGLYQDEHGDFAESMARQRRLRGKAPPKRGEGKRSKRKNK